MKWLAILVSVFLVGFLLRSPADITPERAVELVQGGAKLVDVRTPAEFQGGHIEGAVNIPLSDVAARKAEFGKFDAPIVVYCRSGNRSGQAKKILEAAGFKNVSNLGGISNWPRKN